MNRWVATRDLVFGCQPRGATWGSGVGMALAAPNPSPNIKLELKPQTKKHVLCFRVLAYWPIFSGQELVAKDSWPRTRGQGFVAKDSWSRTRGQELVANHSEIHGSEITPTTFKVLSIIEA